MPDPWPYRFELIELKKLFVDEDYQRPLSSFTKKITENYDPAMVGTLIVSERKGKRFAVIDGQTRLEGMRARGEAVAPCLVYMNLTKGQEAQLFARLQVERRGMATFLRFRAALISGDTEAGAIAALVRSAGFKMAGDGDGEGIKSISAVEWIYRRDPELLLATLSVIREAWPMENGSRNYGDRVRGEILKGLARYIRDESPDLQRLAQRMSKLSPTQIRNRANALREGTGSSGGFDRHVRDALIGVYTRRA